MSFEQRWAWEFDAPRERLWTYVADTDWVNRHAGLPPIEARYERLTGGGTRRIVRMRRVVLPIEWEERPTVWRAPEFFEIERRYRRGPLARFFTRTTLETIPGGTRVAVHLALDPASALTRSLLPLFAATGKRGADRAFRLAARLAKRDAAAAPPETGNFGAFAPLLAAGAEPRVIAALAAYVTSAEDRELQRMRPYELADRWKLSRHETLRAFLRATRLGLFNLSWNVLCPACRGAAPGFESLEQLHRGYHCEACDLAFDPVFDRSVEVTFDARPLGRNVAEPELYCIASPQRSPHVHAQAVVAPRSEHQFELTLSQGSYQFNAAGAGIAPFVCSDEESACRLTATLEPGRGIESDQSVGSGEVWIGVTSRGGRLRWRRRAPPGRKKSCFRAPFAAAVGRQP